MFDVPSLLHFYFILLFLVTFPQFLSTKFGNIPGRSNSWEKQTKRNATFVAIKHFFPFKANSHSTSFNPI